eukprot:6348544-Karenia_brevis.AAC.1
MGKLWFGRGLGVKLASSWDMLREIEANLNQVGQTWSQVGAKLEPSRHNLGQDNQKWRSRGPR